jgi:hypothetical protein
MRSKRIKQYLMLLLVIGIVSVAAGGNGTFASFTAETTNANNVFATGTLFLHNTPNGATTCTSESGANNVQNCTTLFNNVTVAPGTTTSAYLTLTNAGTLNAGGISFHRSSCTDGTPTVANLSANLTGSGQTTISTTALSQKLVAGTPIDVKDPNNTPTSQQFIVAADANAGATSITIQSANVSGTFTSATGIVVLDTSAFTSGQTLCNALNLSIEELNQTGYPNGNGATVQKCVWGTPGGGNLCDYTDTTNFAISNISTTSSALSLLSGGGNGNTAGELDAGKSRYFAIRVSAPSATANTAQNAQVSFSLTWHIQYP